MMPFPEIPRLGAGFQYPLDHTVNLRMFFL